MDDFGGVGIVPLLKAVTQATMGQFLAITLFIIWILGTASSYFAILKTTGNKRFWQCLTSMSFATFLMSLVLAGMNEATFTFLSGYWVGFYIVMTMASFFLLDRYK